jgi:hypothetical protein
MLWGGHMLAKSFGRFACRSLAFGTTLFVCSSGAMAQTTTTLFKPNPVDLYDLDHHELYTWRIGGINLTGKTITGATLRFKNIANWRIEPNILHVHMFDTVLNSGVWSFLDDNPYDDVLHNDGVVDLTDDFISTRYHNGQNALGQYSPWGIGPGTTSVFLFDKSFTTAPTTVNFDLVANGFLDELNTFILNGNNVAFGFDPDCHFTNDGIELEIKTIPTSSNQIPEPASLLFLAGGMLLGRRVMRER